MKSSHRLYEEFQLDCKEQKNRCRHWLTWIEIQRVPNRNTSFFISLSAPSDVHQPLFTSVLAKNIFESFEHGHTIQWKHFPIFTSKSSVFYTLHNSVVATSLSCRLKLHKYCGIYNSSLTFFIQTKFLYMGSLLLLFWRQLPPVAINLRKVIIVIPGYRKYPPFEQHAG